MTAVEALPQPQAIDAVVFVDVLTRTLTVRLPDQASGYERLLWTQGWQALRRSHEGGWPPDGAPWVFAEAPKSYRVIHGVPEAGGALSFTWPVGSPGFAELVSRPGVVAIVTIDRGSQRFMTCRFLHRPR